METRFTKQLMTPAELEAYVPSGTLVAVLGSEAVFHSSLYNSALANMVALKPELSQWRFVAIDCQPEELHGVIKTLHAKKAWGIVFTRPLKSAAYYCLTGIAPLGSSAPIASPTAQPEPVAPLPALGNIDAVAERVGAINLALWRPNGYWGLSTDGAAFAQALEAELNLKVKGKTVFVIGAGATARAIALYSLQCGCRELWIGNRTQENAWSAVDQIVPSLNMRGRTHTFNCVKPSTKVPKSGIVVNALPMGVPLPVDIKRFDGNSAYFDVALISSEANAAADKLEMPNAYGRRLFAWQVANHLEQLLGAKADYDFILWTLGEALNHFTL